MSTLSLLVAQKVVVLTTFGLTNDGKCGFDVNFVFTGGTEGCRFNNLRSYQWRQMWHHDDPGGDFQCGLTDRQQRMDFGSNKIKYKCFPSRECNYKYDWNNYVYSDFNV